MPTNTKSLVTDTNGMPIPQFFDSTKDNYVPYTVVESITFHNYANAVGNGTEFQVGYYKTITLDTIGSSTARTLIFEVCGDNNTWLPITGIRNSDLTPMTQTTSQGESFTFSVTGFKAFRVRISAISGGNIVVKGRAVAI